MVQSPPQFGHGQLVVGPPGSGKTTYCRGVHEFLTTIAKRKVAIVNLDPANDALPYQPAFDIADLVDLNNVQQQLGLGPNGGLLYCMEYLSENLDWLDQQLQPLLASTLMFAPCTRVPAPHTHTILQARHTYSLTCPVK